MNSIQRIMQLPAVPTVDNHGEESYGSSKRRNETFGDERRPWPDVVHDALLSKPKARHHLGPCLHCQLDEPVPLSAIIRHFQPIQIPLMTRPSATAATLEHCTKGDDNTCHVAQFS